MNPIGIVVITIVMACAVAGALASLRRPDRGLGKEFLEGLHSIGYIFVPVAGIMVSIPFLARFVGAVFGTLYGWLGADPALAATSFIAADMGGYQLAAALAGSAGALVMALFTGVMMGSTIVFSVPVGLSLLDERDHKYMALGVLSGLLAIPVGVMAASLLAALMRPEVATAAGGTRELSLSVPAILLNLLPLVILVGLLALGLARYPDRMVRGFMAFGRFMDAAIKLVLAAAIVQYFTGIFYGQGLFTSLFGGWGFDPAIADYDQIRAKVRAAGVDGLQEGDVIRALEVAGYIGLMLSGAFPMVYLLKKHLAGPMERAGRRLGLSATGAAGILAASANILAMFRLVRDMPPRDKVLNVAFAVCAAFLFGDHLAFTANFQPNLLAPVMAGKLCGGVFAFWLACRLSVPKAFELERQDMIDRAREVLAQIPAMQGKQLTIKLLPGGLTNQNFKIDADDGRSYVLRIAGANTGLLGIDRRRELVCCEAAAAAGVGPAVIYHAPDYSVMLSEFIRGKGLTPEDLRDPRMLRRVAEALRRCHGHPVPDDLGTFSPFRAVREYHALAAEHKVGLPPGLAGALDLFTRVEKELHTDEPTCLCHNDLLIANFIDDGNAVRIIDWEYGGRGDRFFDLGNLAVNNDFDDDQERLLLEAYFGEARPEHLRRLRLMRLASDMREAMWSFAQAGVSKLGSPEEYRKRGLEHLDRFLREAARMGI